MKTISQTPSESASGRNYWRSLDQLADTPEFQQWMEREFPAGASELGEGVNRRHFVKIMSASFLLAGMGLTGCRRPEETILPFATMPEDYVHGVSKYYATAMPGRWGAVPLVVRAHEGRPVKLTGNSIHPDSNGATTAQVQASLLDLYDPDRAQKFTQEGQPVKREQAVAFLQGLAEKWGGNQGKGVAFLVEPSSSPSRKRLQEKLLEKYPQASWYAYDSLDTASARVGFRPRLTLEKAGVVLSLDADFLGANDEDSSRNTRGFAQARKISSPEDKLNRLYMVEPLLSTTGANADHRLRTPASQVAGIAARIALEVAAAVGGISGADAEFLKALKSLAGEAESDASWIHECAQDLLAHRGDSVVLAGEGQPDAVPMIARWMNRVLGNEGTTVEYIATGLDGKNLETLVGNLNDGEVTDLVILGGNPAFDAPADFNWVETQQKATTVVRLGYHPDETAAAAQWVLPETHYLESWGDARTSDGTYVPVQPLIRPLFDGMTALELLSLLAGDASTNPYDIVRETCKGVAGADHFDEQWKHFLHDGFLPGSAKIHTHEWDAGAGLNALRSWSPVGAPSIERLEAVFYPDAGIGDGRYNNNGWLQELPDPVTKLSWDNAVLLNSRTAGELGLENEDVVTLSVGGTEIQGPVWIQPGLADYIIGLALGYGRSTTGRVGSGTGFDVNPLRISGRLHFTHDVQVSSTGTRQDLASVQDHWTMAGRAIVREANYEQYQEHPDFANRVGIEAHARNEGPIYQHPYEGYQKKLEQGGSVGPIVKSDMHQWGMSIDLNACTGCNACVLACQSENNIPIVGKDQVRRGREMHWIRIDRYFSLDATKPLDEQLDSPQVSYQPMGCLHCENAPCESVCPVNATVHDEEGLNVMAYNRCVGTRYCSNNCPYKVRRFNFFDYNKRPLDRLYEGPLAKRPKQDLDLAELIRNPDVSVRMRGVMEKCTFCVQRIESAKITQKVKAGASDDIEVPDGAIRTACEEVCPAEAIVFGNTLDPNSRVSQLKQLERDYSVLGYLDTKPRLTYLARVRNPNPKMPDYHASPLSLSEYAARNGDPFASHESHASDESSEEHQEKGGH